MPPARRSRKSGIIYWLIPAQPEKDLFRKLIRILARQFDAPVFEPHITLCMAQNRKPAILRSLKRNPLRLRITGLDFSPKFTKTLFVRFKTGPALKQLARELGCGPGSPRDPHLSLLYKKLRADVKKELASTIKLPFREVIFDSIMAVRCIAPTETRADVEKWRVVARKKLAR